MVQGSYTYVSGTEAKYLNYTLCVNSCYIVHVRAYVCMHVCIQLCARRVCVHACSSRLSSVNLRVLWWLIQVCQLCWQIFKVLFLCEYFISIRFVHVLYIYFSLVLPPDGGRTG